MNIKSALKTIKVTGSDAEKFLQGQLSCDINDVTADKLHLGAHCNIKGRIESLFQLFKIDEDIYLLMPASIIEHALSLLNKYAVFSKVELSIVSLDELAMPVELPEDFDSWRVQQIELGIPTLFPETIAKFLPHDINLPELGGVSFNKGCYLGQEIVARMQHLGKPKRHMIKANIAGNPCEKLDDGGIIVDSVDSIGLVVVSV